MLFHPVSLLKMLLKSIKGFGDMVLVAITPRTTIELPAHLTQAEIDARVEIYKNCIVLKYRRLQIAIRGIKIP